MLRPAKVATIIRREYLARVRTKAFWISTVLVPVFMLAMGVLPSYFLRRSGGDFAVALMTSNTPLAQRIEKELLARSPGETSDMANVRITLEVVAPQKDFTTQRDRLRTRILDKQLAALVVVPDDVLESGKVEYVSTNLTAFRLMSRIENAIERAVVADRLENAGVPAARVSALTKGITVDTVRVTQSGEESKESEGRSFLLSYVLTILIYITMMIYGNYVMRGVLEEKSSRIVEVIVANLSASELMAGKILGIGAVGLTQYAIWAIAAMNLAVPGLLGSDTGAGFGAVLSPRLLFFFVLFFVLGYFLFATIYAAVGAAFNTEEEAQQLQSVLSMSMAIPFVLMFPVLANPDSTSSVVLSLIPFFAPMLFFLRMTVSMPPVWQIALCLALLLATLVVMVRVAAAVYRVGILMYGKKPSLKEIVRWVRAS